MTMKAGIAFGSNVEPRLLHLQAARRRVFELHSTPAPVLSSKVYETAPVDCPDGSPSFLNAVLEITTDLEPSAILVRLQAIECELGRPAAHGHNAPRTIDLDLLYCDDLQISESDLTLPHPRIAERLFVLQPLSDIRPELVLPGLEKTVAELSQSMPADGTISEYCGSIY